MDTEPTVEDQLLRHAKKQTDALESLRTIAIVWSFFAVLGALTWLFITIAAG